MVPQYSKVYEMHQKKQKTKNSLIGSFTGETIYIKKEYQVNNFKFYFKELKKEQHAKPKAIRRKKIQKIKAEIKKWEQK